MTKLEPEKGDLADSLHAYAIAQWPTGAARETLRPAAITTAAAESRRDDGNGKDSTTASPVGDAHRPMSTWLSGNIHTDRRK